MAETSVFAAFRNATRQKALSPVRSGGWRPLIREMFAGAWQRNEELSTEDTLTFPPVFACMTLIASDISKLGLSLQRQSRDGVWDRADHRLNALVRRPNPYQTRAQFIESWVLSKLSRGNAYVLKQRSGSRVQALHVLHPDNVMPLVSDSGNVYYELKTDNLSGIEGERLVVPDSEIIHDRFNCLYHPLVGLSPVTAAALPILQGVRIQENSATFFSNNSTPGGILIAPGDIADETAKQMKEQWDRAHGGESRGGVAVLGGGLKFEPMGMAASDAQLIEQLRWTAEIVCSLFHVPQYKIGVGQLPSYNNIQALNQEYFSQSLQRLITDIQRLLNSGLDVPADHGFRFDIDALLMMDTKTQVEVLDKAVGGGFMRPNDAARKLNQRPVPGGDTFYLQQQNYSLEALSKRDAQDNPFSAQSASVAAADQEDVAAMRSYLATQKAIASMNKSLEPTHVI